ncbi:MAG: hypothetical protein BGO12_10435 [Verrucomicrobia bacterium 61-8]|nr:hypothetical protein [Verrucomicrobiota bacterium]OJV26192.1 MAG: hypothetical protein BGO12_10435 [Verrucomicrobia bacterium 61-8]
MKRALLFLAIPTMAWSQSVPDLIRKTDALDAKNRNAEALVVIQQADQLSPGNAEILYRLAKQKAQLMLDAKSSAERKQLGAEALDAAQRAVAADPKSAEAHLSLAIVYGRIAQDESARRKVELSRLIRDEAEIAAKLDPKEDYAWHVLGRWNYEMANFNAVLKALAQAIYGKFPDASNEKAVEYLEKAVALRPDRVVHQIELGRAYLAIGEKDKARAALEKGLSLPSLAKDDNETKERGRKALSQLN